MAEPGFRDHREEAERIRELHDRVDVAGRLDRAGRAELPVVARSIGAPRRSSATKTRTNSRTPTASGGAEVARVADGLLDPRRCPPGAERRGAHGQRRSDQRAQRAVEAPLAGELAPPRRREPDVRLCRRRARARRSVSIAASSAPRSAKRRPSPVIGSMKPAASPARSSPGTPARRGLDGERPEQVTRGHAPGAPANAARQHRVARGASARAGAQDRPAPAGPASRRRRWRGAPGSGATPT